MMTSCVCVRADASVPGAAKRQIPPGVAWEPNLPAAVKDWKAHTRVLPLVQHGLPTIYENEVQLHIRASVGDTHYHVHTFTCKKGKLYRRGDHFDCRMQYDLPLVPRTMHLADGVFAVRRDHGLLPAYIPALQLVYPANHTFQLNCEGSRYLREWLLWSDAKEYNAKVGPRTLPVVHMARTHVTWNDVGCAGGRTNAAARRNSSSSAIGVQHELQHQGRKQELEQRRREVRHRSGESHPHS